MYNDETLKLTVGMKKETEEESNRNYVLDSDRDFKRTKAGRGWKLTEPENFMGFRMLL